MFVSSIKENYQSMGLPQRFVEILPETCESCGAPLEISETLTGLRCSNPRCKDKLVMRVKALVLDLGILTFGESTIEKFLECWNIDGPMDIFGLEKGDSLSPNVSQKVSDCIIEQLQGKKSMLLWEYVMYSNIPFVRTSARKIFQGYKTLEDAYTAIEEGGIPFIQERLGTSGGEGQVLSLQATKVYKSLILFKDELLGSVGYVDIVNLDGIKELNVVCSDQVGGRFAKKAEFYAHVNNTFADKVHVNFLPAVNKGIDYLVWAGADGSPARYTSKVKTVEGYNAKGCNIPIVTAEQFIQIVKDM